jgi:hypothetical protein
MKNKKTLCIAINVAIGFMGVVAFLVCWMGG